MKNQADDGRLSLIVISTSLNHYFLLTIQKVLGMDNLPLVSSR